MKRQEPGGQIGQDTTVLGQLTSSARVARGVRLIVHGQVAGDVEIDDGGMLELRGQVTGNVVNFGRLELFGQIGGSLLDRSGDSWVAPGAEIIGDS